LEGLGLCVSFDAYATFSLEEVDKILLNETLMDAQLTEPAAFFFFGSNPLCSLNLPVVFRVWILVMVSVLCVRRHSRRTYPRTDLSQLIGLFVDCIRHPKAVEYLQCTHMEAVSSTVLYPVNFIIENPRIQPQTTCPSSSHEPGWTGTDDDEVIVCHLVIHGK
jgi:hypothetical protein